MPGAGPHRSRSQANGTLALGSRSPGRERRSGADTRMDTAYPTRPAEVRSLRSRTGGSSRRAPPPGHSATGVRGASAKPSSDGTTATRPRRSSSRATGDQLVGPTSGLCTRTNAGSRDGEATGAVCRRESGPSCVSRWECLRPTVASRAGVGESESSPGTWCKNAARARILRVGRAHWSVFRRWFS